MGEKTDPRMNSLRLANRELARRAQDNAAILKDVAAEVQKALGGFTPSWHDLPDLVRALAEDLRGERSVRAMTVGRLGGTVEGKPTHSGNFLQRIDELREREHGWHEMVMAEAAELGLEWRDYKGVVPGDFKALMRELKDLLRYVVAEHDHKRPSDDPDTSGDRKKWRRIRKILEGR